MSMPEDLSELLRSMAADLPSMLQGNLVGIYLWGSLTYGAFDEACSDVDCVAVTRRDLDDREFSALDGWFRSRAARNRWVGRLDMRFVIEHEFLDRTSRCCGYYPYTGKLVRHASDANPIIWMNVARSGITLCGTDARLVSPPVSEQCLDDALRQELDYLKQDLASNAGDRSDRAFVHNAYAVLTACRILYSAHHRVLVSKEQACSWAMDTLPAAWRPIVRAARENRLRHAGSTTRPLEEDAMRLVGFVAGEVHRMVTRSRGT